MSTPKHLSLFQRITLAFESLLMTLFVPKQSVGPFFGFLFRMPLVLHKVGLDFLIPRQILILTTVGRRTGIPHQTPLEFSYDADKDTFVVMSGWEGKTDWYRNARANPDVSIWVEGQEIRALAEPASDHEVAKLLKEITQLNPRAKRIWSRWSTIEIDGSEESFLAAAPHFPVLYLRP